ncbi:hypothetical protein COCC4DRAFT_182628 [Bipolaris maydis ATCC 48331]|uniref:Uncharacterized protein n=1 Tax=Cochliobolus heterostrophus (strain C4 / ATCC 48331 / race T) TaxID=665024 RepID=N4WH43_COCH4|nr:uncharacterized protein COCC4DRAFT_182628 [Bipolaris maydis ATCC 48331]KAJ5021261.1 hypothetical protein J3E73DRAFT_435098 [Bipolaris maydis]ENH98539.1 hypothetical protein COCC4DRAFT_182628 [Bipolaris maydis ATCC 48331]KAJ6203517.1 hypothetical protein PSV09DRAFT_2229339 [Bipolaris maydis]KAJ6265089.1 hypothetical protein PSV08DRAFT_366992 [Bipolaris maydis]KAJ6276630.1 hypothetical protein J3E71DRAFT_357172 [Bipolaris maydis]
MHFTGFTVVAFSAFLLTGTVSAGVGSGWCHQRNNCCYSSGAACRRQFGWDITGVCDEGSHDPSLWTLCEEVNVTRKQCDADCCDIKTGWGRGCPN